MGIYLYGILMEYIIQRSRCARPGSTALTAVPAEEPTTQRRVPAGSNMPVDDSIFVHLRDSGGGGSDRSTGPGVCARR